MSEASMGSASRAWRALSRGDSSCSGSDCSAAPLLQPKENHMSVGRSIQGGGGTHHRGDTSPSASTKIVVHWGSEAGFEKAGGPPGPYLSAAASAVAAAAPSCKSRTHPAAAAAVSAFSAAKPACMARPAACTPQTLITAVYSRWHVNQLHTPSILRNPHLCCPQTHAAVHCWPCKSWALNPCCCTWPRGHMHPRHPS